MATNQLITRCINKDPSAEKELYYAYVKYIFGICRRYTDDQGEAEDYVQDSFAKIFKNLKQFDPKKGQFKSWVSTITAYTILSDKKKKKIRIKILFPEKFDFNNIRTEDHAEERESLLNGVTKDQLMLALSQLQKDDREILNLHVFEDWKHKDIAQLLNLEISSCRSRLSRAKQRLKKILIHAYPSIEETAFINL